MDLYTGTSSTVFLRLFGLEKGFQKIKECGFDCVDFDFNQEDCAEILRTGEGLQEYFDTIKRYADAAGVKVWQTYLSTDGENARVNVAQNAIKATAVLGAKYTVIEPIVLSDSENTFVENLDKNVAYYGALKEMAKEKGVTVAVPNTVGYNEIKKTGVPNAYSSAGKILQLLEHLGEGFCACLDTARSYYAGQQPAHTAYLLGDKLQVMRLADCDGQGTERLALTAGYIGWDNVFTALREIGFSGALNFDIDYLRSGERTLVYLGQLMNALGRGYIAKMA